MLYYLAKVITDIPKLLVTSLLYFLALQIFIPFRAKFFELYWIILLLYMNSFSLGYFLAFLLPREILPLAGSGFALAWSLALSGVIPSVETIEKEYGYISWLWQLSAPRWGIETMWLKVIDARSFIDAKPPNKPPYGHKWSDYDYGMKKMIGIAFMWHMAAFLCLKLRCRSKQR